MDSTPSRLLPTIDGDRIDTLVQGPKPPSEFDTQPRACIAQPEGAEAEESVPMRKDPRHPEPGDLIIDASAVKTKDLAAEQISKLSKVRDGYEDAVACLGRLAPAMLARAGIFPEAARRAVELTASRKYTLELLPAVVRLHELLTNTSHWQAHEISGILTEAANTARKRAERDPEGEEILAAVEELLDYHFGPAGKRAATMKKTQSDPPARSDGNARPSKHPSKPSRRSPKKA